MASETIFPSHEGRVAVVTGAARGLGQAISRGLAERGATVIGVDRLDLSETEEIVTAAGAVFRGFAVDLTEQTSVSSLGDEIRAEFGRADILVNNAGVGDAATWYDLTYEQFRRVLEINLHSQFLMAKALTPLMRSNGYGRIVNISSSAVNAVMEDNIAYRVSKMGVIGLTRALASLGQDGITANAISPAATPTLIDPERGAQDYSGFQSIKRIAQPADIVPTVAFLSSEASYWVTGQSFNADGGFSFTLP